MADLGRGMVQCVKWYWPLDGKPGLECAALTEGALYFCEKLGDDVIMSCPWDQCGHTYVLLRDRFCQCFNSEIAYCPNLFRPLNDGDTSLVDDEEPLDIKESQLV